MFGSRHYYDDGLMRRPRFGRALPRRFAAKVSAFFNLVFGILYAIIGLRIVLEFFGAREGNKFKELVNHLSAPLLGMFEGLFQNVSIGHHKLVLSFVFALAIYALVHYGSRRLIGGLARSRGF